MVLLSSFISSNWQVIDILNLLYCMAQIIEFLAFIELRRNHDHLHRPYRIPVGFAGAVGLMVLPLVFVVLIFAISSIKTIILACAGAIVGVAAFYLLERARARGWCVFEPLPSTTYLPVIIGDRKVNLPADLAIRRLDETSGLLDKHSS